MKGKGFIIMDEFFPTKISLENRIREIRDRYLEGQQLIPEDYFFMIEVLEGHPEYSAKKGPGIVSMSVRTNPLYTNTRCFWLTRLDETETDFSFKECLTPTSHKKKFLRALRAAIEPQIINFKKSYFDNLSTTAYCPFTQEKLDFVGSHVDHVAPNTFEKIAGDFAAAYHIDIDQVEIAGDIEDNTYQNTLIDQVLLEKWVAYHNGNAVLQVVSRRANLSHLRIR
jgi:hypothetical protein